MKKKYVEPMIVVEDFSLSDAIAIRNCKYTPNNIGLIQQMSAAVDACRDPSNNQSANADYSEFSNIYNGNYDLDQDGNFYELKDDMGFTKDYAKDNVGNCGVDPFEIENLSFGKDVAGRMCKQYIDGIGGDSVLLQNS